MAFLGQGVINIILALMMSRWVQYCRVVRGEVLSLKERDFVTAAKALGGKDFYVLLKHVVPNTFASVTVIATFAMAIVIISEASLSFLGLGVPASIPTWGSMLSEGRSYMNRAPWLTIFPGLAIFITAFRYQSAGRRAARYIDPEAAETSLAAKAVLNAFKQFNPVQKLKRGDNILREDRMTKRRPALAGEIF
jgi:peptide/nickel transport system permease protein